MSLIVITRTGTGRSRRRQPSRISRSVELLVVRIRPVGNAREVRRPGDLREKPKGLGDVRLDLAALACRSGFPSGSRGNAISSSSSSGRTRAGRVAETEVSAARPMSALTSRREQARLVGPRHDLPGSLQDAHPFGEPPPTFRSVHFSSRRPLPGVRRGGEDRLLDPRANELLAPGRKLPRLDQDLLAHADLAEIVKDRRVAELAQLLAADVKGRERPASPAGRRAPRGGRRAARRARSGPTSSDRAARSPSREASTKPSKRRRMLSVRRRFSTATAAWAASDRASSSFASSNGTTSIRMNAVTVASGIERLLPVQELEHADRAPSRRLHRERRASSAIR